MRVTLGMISNQYNRNLNKSLGMLNYYNNRATTFRKFDTASEDPMMAAKAYHLRREYLKNDNFKSNLTEAEGLMETAQTSVININTIIQEAASGDCIQAINGTMGKEERSIIAAKLKKMQDAIVARMNDKYGDKYLFSGNDSAQTPFTVSSDGKLLYKGVDVTNGKHIGADAVPVYCNVGNSKINFGKENADALNGYTINIKNTAGTDSINPTSKVINLFLSNTATKQDLQNSLQTLLSGKVADSSKITVDGTLTDTILSDVTGEINGGMNAIPAGTTVNLDTLAKQNLFIDVGLGLKINPDGSVDPQSAFDVSVPGIAVLGYGVNNNGIPNNLHTLLGEITKQLESDNFSIDKIQPYLDNFNVGKQSLLTKLTEFGSKSNLLEYTSNKLEDTKFNLNTKIKNVEYIEPSEAIMDFKMQEFVYRAALQMGTKILQPSFLDFMR